MTSAIAISPEDAADWLQYHGWQRVSPLGRVASLWRHNDREILLPMQRDSVDFTRRISELLSELSKAEERSPELLQIEMVNIGADICEWRAAHTSLIDDSIPLPDGEKLISSAKNALVAAASATIHRRGYFGHAVPQRARDHAQTVRMGQSQRGSYVIPVISRLPVELTQDDEAALLPISSMQDRLDTQGNEDNVAVRREPFSRQVMGTLFQALDSVRLIAESGEEVEPRLVNESVGDGVSYELCNALSNCLHAESIDTLDIQFSWARRLPRPQETTRRISFPKGLSSSVDQMTDILRGSAIVGIQTIVGTVNSMRHESDPNQDSVVVRTVLGGGRRNVRMSLPAQFREEATRAFNDQNRLVYVRGRLSRQPGRSWEFSEVSDFGLAYELPLEDWEDIINDPRNS